MPENKVTEENKTVSAEEAPAFETEIKETAVSDLPVYEDDEEEEAVKPKKKFKKRFVVIPLLLIIAGVIAFMVIRSKAAPQMKMVSVEEVSSGDIENVISISGNVVSAETQTIYADVDGTLREVKVKVGDKIKKGDLLFTYDTEKLDLAVKQAELAISQAKGNYNSLYTATGAADRKYAEGMTAQQINDRLDVLTLAIDEINYKITEKKNRMNQTLTDLNKTAMDINQNGIKDGTLDDTDYDQRRENDNNNSEMSESNRQMLLAVQQSIQDYQYALSNDTEIQAWEAQINALKEEQAHLNAAKSAQVNYGSASAQKASMESAELTNEAKIEHLEAAKDGVYAEFDAVVTAVDVSEGQTVTAGSKMITLSSLEQIEVTVQVSKSDLSKLSTGLVADVTVNGRDYQGEISRISGTATKNSNGVPVVETTIRIKDPDDGIILGVEASNKIHAQKAENTIVLPYEYILTDAEGDYVYTLENDTVVRKDITIGISTSTRAQVLEGLKEGDRVITSDLDMLEEGQVVAELGI